MTEFYWGCLIGGAVFALVVVIFGDLIGNFFDGAFDFLSQDHLDFLSPTVVVGGITVFGGAGIMLTRHSALGKFPVFVLSIILAVLVSLLVYFAYVKPMKRAENSTCFSVRELMGKIGEVTIPIPAKGMGEVMLRVGAGNTNQIAGSFQGEEIQVGTKVVVTETSEGILYVIKFDED